MDPNEDPTQNLIGSLCNDFEKRVWTSTYERMQRNGDFTEESLRAADFAVLEYRKRS